ncbi:MAG: metal-sulfur cluster assembly factor [Burkholderiaceae bacterium]|nr:metal-sulfur cluster assembly factor [Burkholderiaceae bacterium]MEB2351158.1 metal-sulfur cluster assembly factor [Burkholderiaceae bacterium]
MGSPTREQLREMLKDVFDPELGYNIVDLGLVYGVEIAETVVTVTMTLTTPGCPASDMIQAGVRNRLEEAEGVGQVVVDLVWEPPWGPDAMSPAAKEHFGVES